MNIRICLLPGDGIGPEIVNQAVGVLDRVAAKFGHTITTTSALIGGIAIDTTGIPLPEETITQCQKADAILLGAVGGPKWDTIDPAIRPEKGLLGIRKALDLFANLRPATLFKELTSASYLRPDIIGQGLDIMVVRELTGGAYFGEPRGETVVNGERAAFNTMIYTESEIERIVHVACKIAMKRGKRLCSVDKANVLDVSRLWREVTIRTAAQYPEIQLSHMYVDNAAMQLIRDPSQFDVLVTENLFGDILSDEASIITGSIGMLPSASMGTTGPALFEPIHGSAPDIAGQDLANPLATILSVAMMFRYSFNLTTEALAVEQAVHKVLAQGYRTGDIYVGQGTKVGCSKMGTLVAEALA
jgi:3-isopropylmalate dehydrogenase